MIREIRLLLWLKLSLSWRGYRRNKMQWLSVVLFVVLLAPIAIISEGFNSILSDASDPMRLALSRDCLAVIYLFWIITPLIGFQFNESYDVTKLFAYPLTYGQIFLGSVIGGLFEPAVMLVIPPLAVILAAFSSGTASYLIGGVILLLFLLQTIASAQAVTFLLVGFLRSRRFRDITMVILPIIGLAYYVGQQTLVSHFQDMRYGDLSIFTANAWSFSNWLPPGIAARGIAAQTAGGAAAAILLLALMTTVAMAISAIALRRLYMGDAVAFPVTPSPQGKGDRASASRGGDYLERLSPWSGHWYGNRLLSWLPDDIASLAMKEIVYLQRDPQYKAVLVQMAYTVIVIAIPFILPGYHVRSLLNFTGPMQALPLLGVAGILMFAVSPLIFNLFGGEGAAVTVLFSFPTSRRNILLAKNIAHAGLLLLLSLIGLTAAAAVTKRWEGLIAAFGSVVIAIPVLLAAGNLVSIKLPHRMMVRGQRWHRGGVATSGGDNSGCAYAFLYLLAHLTAGLCVLPVLVAAIGPMFTQSPAEWYAFSIPLAVLYSGALYVILLGVAERWLLSREPEIAAAVVPPE